MEKYSISVLGADKKQYEIADFRARGMNYANAIGIIVETEFTIGSKDRDALF